MKAGFIGTGSIAEAVITGICTSELGAEVIVSPRSKERAERLAQRFEQVTIATDNQAVIDSADWVFITVRPDIADQLLPQLNFRPGQIIINCVATLTIDRCRAMIGEDKQIYKAIPLPPVAKRLGPLVYCPPSAELSRCFNQIGTAVAVEDEAGLQAIASTTGLIASYFAFQQTAQSWLQHNGVADEQARAFLSSMFHALSVQAKSESELSFEALMAEAATAGGLNEQVVNELTEGGWLNQVDTALTHILARLRSS